MKIEDWEKEHSLTAEDVITVGDFFSGLEPKPKANRHMEICEKLNEIYRAKNEAYGDSFGETYRKLGIISAITRMTDKMSRLTALCTGAQNNVKDESIRDTALDLANYSIMLVMEMDEEKQRGEFPKELKLYE